LRVEILEFCAEGFGVRVQSLGFRVKRLIKGSGFRVQSSRFRFKDL
jgi:hypothetical protein